MNRESEKVARYADIFAALGTEPRLRIVQLLLSAHPDGMTAGEIQGSSASRTRLFRTTSKNSGPKV